MDIHEWLLNNRIDSLLTIKNTNGTHLTEQLQQHIDASIKLIRLDNSEGTATCKQHAFIPKMFTDKWTNETYKGNIAMCNKAWASDDGERPTKWDELEEEGFNPDKICRKCLVKLKASLKTKNLPPNVK